MERHAAAQILAKTTTALAGAASRSQTRTETSTVRGATGEAGRNVRRVASREELAATERRIVAENATIQSKIFFDQFTYF